MLQKRLDYGFSGYQVPFIPRAARSARKRGPIRKKIDGNQMCAFDLLATVAGNLLEGESSHDKCTGVDEVVNAERIATEVQCDGGNKLEAEIENCHQGSVGVPSLSLELGLPVQAGHYDVNEIPGHQHEISSALGSDITLSDCMGKDDSPAKVDLCDDKSELCSHAGDLGVTPVYMETCPPNLDESVEEHGGGAGLLIGNGPDIHSSEDPKFFDRKPLAMVTSDGSAKLSLGIDHYPCGSLSLSRDNIVKVGTRDDDENLSECIQPSTMKTTRLPARIGDRRIRRLLASKYWRIAPKVKDGDHSDNELRNVYRCRKIGYKRQRSQRIYPFKKRKFYHYSSFSNSEGCNGVYSSPKKIIDTAAMGHGVNGSSSCVAGQSTTFPSRESHVRVRIKSFRVPELFVEMPETATIGSLKRRVMEAVTALLGDGLHVGVLLQGKKVRDDNRTLLQSGICHDNKVDSLGFTLEPSASHTSLPVCSEDNSVLLSSDIPEPVSKYPAIAMIHQGNSHLSSDHPVPNLGNLIESDHDSAPSPAEMSADKGTVDSRALVALPEGTPQALALVPAHQKSKRSDLAQRRIRRPFSVTEVEALVQAVEKLGTGRWRDVKLRAFDNVKHRTYVDLKDKWKTLVHTAQISPQQRRGEPVPQELLDRVLAAHSYWSQQQAKQHLKQQSEACLLL